MVAKLEETLDNIAATEEGTTSCASSIPRYSQDFHRAELD